jgi:hypothetical protein
MRRLMLLVMCWLWAAMAQAGDLLYATDGSALFTVDQATGARTFVSDGPLKWLCSPSFDEQHHTRFWSCDGGYCFVNPFTGERGGPYPWSISFNHYPGGDPLSLPGGGCMTDIVYAPTTQRLYAIAWWWEFGSTDGTVAMPIMFDQFNGPAVENWGGAYYLDLPWERGFLTATAFDPTSGMILVGVSGVTDRPDNNYGLVSLDPVTGLIGQRTLFGHQQPPRENLTQAFINSMAVQPETGDIFYVRSEQAFIGVAATPFTLRRWDRALGQDFEICTLDAPLELRFASDTYISP